MAADIIFRKANFNRGFGDTAIKNETVTDYHGYSSRCPAYLTAEFELWFLPSAAPAADTHLPS